MYAEKSNAWRSKETLRHCKRCNCEFVGKYNSSSCVDCKKAVKQKCFSAFKQANPNYFKEYDKTTKGRQIRKRQQLSTYGLTLFCFDNLLKKQGGACAICGKSSGWKANGGNLVVDHCHKSKNVRGLLCPSCNRGLGQFEDNPDFLKKAVWYVNREIERRQKNQQT
jgi:hypothetical protein